MLINGSFRICAYSVGEFPEDEMNGMQVDKSLLPDPLSAGGVWSSAMSTYADCFQAWAAAGAAWQSEVTRFAQRRLERNFSTWQALLSSPDVASVWQAQRVWSVRAREDYTEEATQLARLVASVAVTGATPEAQETTRLLG